MTDHRLTGGCHCGRVGLTFMPQLAPSALPLRRCGCSFCTKHGAVYTSDPGGRLVIEVTGERALQRYRFATRTGEFLLCRDCGVLLAVLCEIDGHAYAALNANVLEPAIANPIQAVDFEGESLPARLARRQRNWIAEVEVIVGAQARL